MADEPIIWKKYSVIINALLIVLTGLLAWYTFGLFTSSQKSIKQQSDYYEATTRPFVNIVENSIKYPKSNFSPNIYLSIEYIIKNYGSAPAKDIQSSSKFLAYEDSTYKMDFQPGDVRDSIYPNMTQPKHSYNEKMDMNDKNESYLHICIIYKDMAGNTHYSLSIVFFWFNNKGDLIFQHVKSYFD